MSLAKASSILSEFLRENGKSSICIYNLYIYQGKLLMQLLHSRKLCFHSDYDTTDLGLKLEYSNLN